MAWRGESVSAPSGWRPLSPACDPAAAAKPGSAARAINNIVRRIVCLIISTSWEASIKRFMLLRSGWCCYRSRAEFGVRGPPDPSRLKSYNLNTRCATPYLDHDIDTRHSTLQPREPTQQIPDNKRAGDRGKGTR